MERTLIGSVQLNSTQNGRQIADLYSTDTRLKYPVLRLFDLSALITVGLEPQHLEPGQRHVARFWAYYSESDKTNAQGNPYKDVEYLEPIDTPATATSVACPEDLRGACPEGNRGDTSALLDEIRAVRHLLETIAARLVPPSCSEVPAAPPNPETGEACPEEERGVPGPPPARTYQDGSAVGDNPAEAQAFDAYVTAQGQIPAHVDALRQWVLDTPKG